MARTPAEFCKQVLGLPLDEYLRPIEQEHIYYPVIEEDPPLARRRIFFKVIPRVYVKFMSFDGVHDDLLGDLFHAECRRRRTVFQRERKRSGFLMDHRKFPLILGDEQ